MNRTIRNIIVLAAVASLLTLGGCGTIRKISGKAKTPPDEFTVVQHRPLVIPPEYNLAPPEPGKPTPQDLASAPDTLRALFPNDPNVVPQASAGEQALINDIGAQPIADVRSMVSNSETDVVQEGTLLDEIVNIGERKGDAVGSSIEHVKTQENGGK